LYGKLGWEFVGKSDLCFNVKIKENRVRDVKSEKRKKIPEVENLKQIFPILKL